MYTNVRVFEYKSCIFREFYPEFYSASFATSNRIVGSTSVRTMAMIELRKNDGLVFGTHVNSPKVRDFEENPNVPAACPWPCWRL